MISKLSIANSPKWLLAFRAVFLFEVYTYPTKLLEEKTKQLKIIKKFTMAAQKCKKYMVAGSIEGFLISC